MERAKQATLEALLQAGTPLRDIAEQLGTSLASAWRWAQRLSCSRRQHLTPAQRAEIRRLDTEGRLSPRAIAAKFNINPATVRKLRAKPIAREQLATAVRCETCRMLINLVPCVRCQPS